MFNSIILYTRNFWLIDGRPIRGRFARAARVCCHTRQARACVRACLPACVRAWRRAAPFDEGACGDECAHGARHRVRRPCLTHLRPRPHPPSSLTRTRLSVPRSTSPKLPPLYPYPYPPAPSRHCTLHLPLPCTHPPTCTIPARAHTPMASSRARSVLIFFLGCV